MELEVASSRATHMSVSDIKMMPQSSEAEQAVLGGLLLDNNCWDIVTEKLSEVDFYIQEHRLIFRTMASLLSQDNPLDPITLSEYLEKTNDLEAAGGLPYLANLAKNTPTTANIAAYAEIVRERSILRQLIEVGVTISDLGYKPHKRIARELLDLAEQKVFAIAQQGEDERLGPKKISQVLTHTVERIETLFQAKSPITGVSTGFNDFDSMTAGLQGGDLVIVAGRPSMGKTTFAMNMAEHAAMKSDKPILIFSMEMPSEQIAMRMLASLGRIEQQRIRTGQLEDEDWPRLTSAIGLLSSRKLMIDDSGSLSPMDVRARARRIAKEYNGLGMIVVDYLQLMRVPGNNEHRAAEISEISRSLKSIAKELNVPVIALSQLNRGLESRPDKRPVMSDLRESGAIEQDADLIVFIYRDEVYHKDTADKGTAEIIIAKQRNGPIGHVRLTFLGQYSRFENFVRESYEMGENDETTESPY